MGDGTKLAEEILAGKGYVLVPDLLDKQQAAQARRLVLEKIDKGIKQGKISSQEGRERLHGLIYKGEVFLSLVQHPLVMEVVETILGPDFILGGFSAHVLRPQATSMGVHVDYPYWAMKPPFPSHPVLEVQVIWLVEDFTPNNGAPIFAPHTQKLASWPELSKFTQEGEKITGTAGSVLISHGLCWHDTSRNETTEPRVSLLGNYTQKFIHPLENNLYEREAEVIENASPRLKRLLRHDLKSTSQPVFDMA